LRAHLGKFSCFAVLLTACAGAAAAEERVSMPFACQADGGRVKLSPSPFKSYPIVGTHEQRDFTACARARPKSCRNLELHRFKIDCGGATVDWLSVAAALGPWMDKRNPVRGGRMQIEVGPRYYGPPMPCRVRMPYGPPGFYRPTVLMWPCPDGPSPYRQLVSLPAGFAPVPKDLVRFTAAPDPVAQIESTSPPALLAKAEPKATPRVARVLGSNANSANAKTEQGPATKLATSEDEITGAIPAPSGRTSASARKNLIGAVGLGFAALLLFGTAFLLSRRRSKALLAVEMGHERVDQLSTGRPAQEEWLPSTLGEALAVLVANPETDSEWLKEIVKTLRRRWHPDHALDEEDRRARERKLKQINVAWDIVCGKRAARQT
jgi:hypothetical protein